MTWPLRICFSLLLLAAALQAASVSGRVEVQSSRKTRDFSGVVIWLEPLGAETAAAPRRVEMLQKNKTFLPHVLAIPVGSVVEFPNADPIFHNAFSNFSGQIFDVGLYPPRTSRAVAFRRPGIVRVFCNIHPMMSAVIAVLTTPHFTVTGRNGAFEIHNVPAGEYTLRVFHERALETTLKALERRITVGPQTAPLPLISISESGYVPTPHKNKYGKDYSPVQDDRIIYPGGRK